MMRLHRVHRRTTCCPCIAALQDCSITISPISDPTCSSPTDENGYQYGDVQQRAFLYEHQGKFLIRSLFVNTPTFTK